MHGVADPAEKKRLFVRARRTAEACLDTVGFRLALFAFASTGWLAALRQHPGRMTAHYDDHYFFAHDDAARIAMLEHGELPAWNPFACGGIPLAGNPQDESFAPDFLLRLIFGTGPGRTLAVLAFVLIGMEGMARLATRGGASRIGAWTAACLYSASGLFSFMLRFGWINMFGFQLLPWVLLGFERGMTRSAWRLVGAAFLAWIILAGGTYSGPYTLLVLSLVAIVRVVHVSAFWRRWEPRPRARAVIASYGVIVLGAACLSAPKWMPMLRVLGAHPRVLVERPSYPPLRILESLVLPHAMAKAEPQAVAYIGFGVVGVVLLALVLGERRVVGAILGAAFFFLLAMGEQRPISLYGVLRRLPVFGQLRSPERFGFVVAFFLSLGAGHALGALERAPEALRRALHRALSIARHARARALARVFHPTLFRGIGHFIALLAGVALVGALHVENRIPADLYAFDFPLARDAEFKQARGNRWDEHVWARAGRGSLQCFEENPFPVASGLRGDLAAEERPLDPGSADVRRIAWSPNSITLSVDAARDAVVLVNQNHAPEWSSSVGQVIDHGGLLGVRVPAGHHAIVLRYRDGSIAFGIVVAMGFVAGVGALALRKRGRPRAPEPQSATPPRA